MNQPQISRSPVTLPLLHPALSVLPLFSLVRRWPAYLDAPTCADLLDGVDTRHRWQHRLYDPTRPGGTVNLAVRNTKQADTSGIRLSLRALFRDIARTTIEPAYGLQIEWIEEPQLLIYETGGHYAPHANTAAHQRNDCDLTAAGTNRAAAARHLPARQSPARQVPPGREMDRDVSVILYLNEGFSGGTLLFPRLGIEIAPTAGLLLAFPSDARFVHGALPVTAGLRVAMVTWMKARGTIRSTAYPPGFPP